jgi:hypothetical protein
METNFVRSSAESRSGPRTVLRVAATIHFKDAPPMPAKTIDIAQDGLSLLAPEHVPPGTQCGIRFTAMIQGRIAKVEAVAKVVYSICVGTTGFRVGCQFTDMDADTRAAVRQIVDHK